MRHVTRLTAVCGLAVSAGVVQAQVFNWSSAVNGDWSNPSLWTGPGGFPNSATADVFVQPDAAAYELNYNVNATVSTFLVNSSTATFRSAGRTMTIQTLAQLDAGIVAFTGGGFNGPGGLINRTQFGMIGTVSIGTASFTNEGQINVIADGGNNSVLSRTGSMTNSGTLNLTSSAATAATLSSDATVTNSGTFNSLAGAGGGRFITAAAFDNTGTVNINANTSANAANSTFTSSGTFNTAPGATFTFSGGGVLNFSLTGGTLNNQGGFFVNSDRFNFAGGTITGNRVSLLNATLNITGSGAGGFDVVGTSTFLGNIAAGQRVDVVGDGGNNSVLTNAAGYTNNGTLNLTSTAATAATLASDATITNSGTFNSQAGAGGGRVITAAGFDNTGTVNINTNTSANAANSTFTSSGTFNTAPGATFTFSGGGVLNFSMTGGTLNNQGGFFVNSDRFNFAGGTITGNRVSLLNATLDITGSGAGGFDVVGNSTFLGNIAAGQQVNVVADGGNNSVLGNTGGYTNNGTLNLTSTAGTSATLVSDGTVTNSGTFNSQVGSGGGRVITAAGFDNTGTVNINVNTTANAANSTFTSSGTFNTAPGATFTFSGGGLLNFSLAGGTLNNQGAFFVNSDRFNFTGGTITGNRITLLNAALNITGSGVGGFDVIGSSTFLGNIAAAQDVNVLADGSNNSTLSNTGGYTNSGTLNLTSSAATTSTLASDGTVTNSGTLNSQLAAGGGRFISVANLVNDGTLNVNANTGFNGTNATLTNTGTVNISANSTFSVSGSGSVVFNQSAGTLNNLGLMVVSGDTFNFNGGTMLGNRVIVLSGAIGVNTLDGRMSLDAIGSVAYAGNLGADHRIDILANGANNSTLSAAAGFTSNGTINLTSTAATVSTLAVSGTLTNGTSGVISILPGSGGARFVSVAELVNRGAINVDVSTAFNATNGVITNRGQFNVLAGDTATVSGAGTMVFNQESGVLSNLGAFVLNGETFNFSGGQLTGNAVDIIGGELNITATTPGTINAISGVGFSGNVAASQQVNVLANGSFNSTLAAGGGFTNNGLINLTSTAATVSTLAASAPVVNSATGTINVLPGLGGARFMTVSSTFTNNGAYNVNANIAWNGTSATAVNNGFLTLTSTLSIGGGGTTTFTNSALGTVAGVGTLDLTGAEVFTNQGSFEPGLAGIGALSVAGNWRQQDFGRLAIEIGGPGALQYDRMLIGGTATLDGILFVVLTNGYTPSPATSFVVLDASSLSGAFSNGVTQVPVFGGGFFDVIYNTSAGTVTLTNYIPAPGALGVLASVGLIASRRRRNAIVG